MELEAPRQISLQTGIERVSGFRVVSEQGIDEPDATFTDIRLPSGEKIFEFNQHANVTVYQWPSRLLLNGAVTFLLDIANNSGEYSTRMVDTYTDSDSEDQIPDLLRIEATGDSAAPTIVWERKIHRYGFDKWKDGLKHPSTVSILTAPEHDVPPDLLDYIWNTADVPLLGIAKVLVGYLRATKEDAT